MKSNEQDDQTLIWIVIAVLSVFIVISTAGLVIERITRRAYSNESYEKGLHNAGLNCVDPILGHKQCDSSEDTICTRNH